MNRIINAFFAATAMLLACGCGEVDQPAQKMVDLRYRVADSYELAAIDAKQFTIVVTSSAPWEIFSEHPDWCIIDQEEGEASDPDMVLVGKGDKTTVHVQYYDNKQLDDRVDHITIKSDYWIGKVVTITQKGIAYLTIPEDCYEIEVVKAGGEIEIPVSANQDWSSEIIEGGEWLEITEGGQSTGDAPIKLMAAVNPGEKRYASLKIYDRHNVEMALVHLTQDGVQLDPETFEIRAGYDQLNASLNVISNSEWTATKDNDGDTWYDIVNPSNSGDGTLNITLTENTNPEKRVGHIILRSVNPDPEGYVAEKIIAIKQANKVNPVRYLMDNDQMSNWKSDKTNTPVYTKNVGTYFKSEARLNNGDMPFGTYTFRWSSIESGARCRLWFCYSDSQEIKYNIVSADSKVAMEFNCGSSSKPDPSSNSVAIDCSGPVEMTLKFDPSGSQYCHVTYLVNGEQVWSIDSSDSVMNKVIWGKSINMYIGVDTAGSAVLEWYEYTAPVDWDE